MPENMALIGSAQAAKKFGVSRATFNRWVTAGRIEVALELGGRTGIRFFDPDVIDQLVPIYGKDNAEAAA